MTWSYSRILPKNFHPVTLRQLLQENWSLSRKEVHFLRINRAVLINHQYQPMSTLVHADDVIDLTFHAADFSTPIPSFVPDSAANLKILFETEDLLIADKAAGIKTHANQPDETGSLMNHLAAYLQNTSAHPYNVHRLDQQTSGAILVVKNPALIPVYNQLIKTKIIRRTYLAVTQGRFVNRKGIITLPLGKTCYDQRQRVVNGADARNATTTYQIIAQSLHHSLVEIQLQTGRTHQIRVHLASLGHPIMGDPLYNPSYLAGEHMALHSWKIQFPLPFSQQIKEVVAPLPESFQLMNRKKFDYFAN
ncbi:RluA family pseudouridine synthase [Pediococcus siamensis]|uniref:RluA family pseudouridine synthase n=1 Tax=Pediococcus siamensis TaxID=381829 RepID=UPI0039A39321